MDWVKEENYEEYMTSTVEPYVNMRTSSGYFERVQGESIYYEHYKADEPKAAILISHGFTESIKKFTESVYYMLQQGFDVWGVDHRGHGRSFRQNDNPGVVHVEHFEDYVLDFRYFAEEIVFPETEGMPHYLYCHSMGGCIGAWLIEDYPKLFDKAVLSSPMLGLTFGPVPVPVVYMAASIIGIGQRRKNPFGSDGKFNTEPDFEDSCDSSECRYNYYFNKCLNDPYLQTCAPSIQWGKEAAKACRYIFTEADYVRIPVLMFQAGEDTVVRNESQDLYASWLDTCEFVKIPGVKHELFMTDTPVLVPYWEKIFDFLK